MIVDVIISVFNKEKNIQNYYNKIDDELKNIKHRFIFVDNASTDKTLEVLKSIQSKDESNVKIISLSKKHDKDTSIYAGIVNSKHDLVCIYDLDLQANVTYISKMYETITSNKDIDQVCMISNYEEKSFIKKNKIKLLNYIYSLDINNNKTYYRMIRRNVVNALIELTKNYKFSLYSFELLGFNTDYIKFDNNNINNNDLNKYITYSDKPFIIFKTVNLILTGILLILFVLTIFKVLKINTIILMFIIIIFNIINIYLLNITSKFLHKEKTYFTIREKIGFDEKVL